MLEERPITLFGDKTPRVVIYKSESHKLHQAFNVKEGETIVKGMPVALDEDGFIEPYDSTDQVYLGIAITDSVYPAYGPQRNFPVEVTVMVTGYAICNWVAESATNAGYVMPTGDLLNDRFTIVNTSSDETPFIALNKTEDENELVQVLIR